MVDALTSASPRYRYRVGLDSKLLTPLFKCISEASQDWIFSPPEALRRQLLASSMAGDAHQARGRATQTRDPPVRHSTC